MLKHYVISRNAAGSTLMNHVVAGGTYSAPPALITDGFFIKCEAGRNYDAYEFVYVVAGGDATTLGSVRPFYFVPSMDPAAAGGSWISGNVIENISWATASTDVYSPTVRLNSVPVSATRMYLQVVGFTGTAPTNLYMVVSGIEGIVADVSVRDLQVDIEAGDIEIGAVEIKNATTDDRAVVRDANAAAPAVDSHVIMMQIQGPDGLRMPSGANAAGAVYVLPVGGGAAGGGDSVYTSPADFTVTRNADTEILITGLPFTPILAQVVSIYRVDIVTGIGYTYTTSTNTFFWNPGTGILTVTGATFLVTDEFRVTLFGPDKTYTATTNSKRVQEISPLSAQSAWESLVNNAAHTAVGTPFLYPSAAGMSLVGYRSVAAQIQAGTTATITLEASLDPTGTDWEDISRSCYDLKSGASGVANWSGTTAMLDLEACIAPLIRFRVAVTVATLVQIDVRRVAI